MIAEATSLNHGTKRHSLGTFQKALAEVTDSRARSLDLTHPVSSFRNHTVLASRTSAIKINTDLERFRDMPTRTKPPARRTLHKADLSFADGTQRSVARIADDVREPDVCPVNFQMAH